MHHSVTSGFTRSSIEFLDLNTITALLEFTENFISIHLCRFFNDIHGQTHYREYLFQDWTVPREIEIPTFRSSIFTHNLQCNLYCLETLICRQSSIEENQHFIRSGITVKTMEDARIKEGHSENEEYDTKDSRVEKYIIRSIYWRRYIWNQMIDH